MLLSKNKWSNIEIFYIFIVLIWYLFQLISLKLRIFLLDLAEYNASSMVNLIPPSNIIMTLSKPWIKFTKPDIVFTLISGNVKFEK